MSLTHRPGLLTGLRDRSRDEPVRPQVALVLSSGSTLGAAQVGHIRALLEAGLRPDVIVGCSIGSLNGAALAAVPTLDGVDAMEDAWRSARSTDLFPLRSARTWARLVVRRDHLCTSEPVRELIARFCPHPDLDGLAIETHVATTNLDTAETCWWTSGPTADILAASTAIPGLFPPVRFAGQRHVDGGVLVPVPVGRAVDLGAAHIFVSDVSVRDKTERGALGVLIDAFNVARYAGSRQPVPQAGQSIAVLPNPDLAGISLTSLDHTDRLITDAYSRTAAWLAELAQFEDPAGPEAKHRRGVWRRHHHERPAAASRAG